MRLSPNCGPRKHGLPPDMVVVHYTAMDTAQAAIDRLCLPEAQVSAHYVIFEDGIVTQLVSDTDRAWHAGAGRWGNVRDVNSHSIGFELANRGPESDTPEFPEPQMQALERELTRVMKRFSIPKERVIGHSDMAPGRKFDPGPYFDWRRLAHKGLSVWYEEAPEINAEGSLLWDRFVNAAKVFGYHAPVNLDTGWEDERAWHVTLEAFRDRFLRISPSRNTAQITGQDVAIMEDLAARYPVKDVDLGEPTP